MAAFFLDASALVKRYVAETGSSWVRQLLDPVAQNQAYVARITGVEIASAIVRRQRGGSLSAVVAQQLLAQFRRDLRNRYRIVELTSNVLMQATDLAIHQGLRAYDAVQLAVALDIDRRRTGSGLAGLTLVSSDGELNAAATAVGLPFEDPNLHP